MNDNLFLNIKDYQHGSNLRSLLLFICLLIPLMLSSSVQAEIHSYIDDRGRKVFVDHPRKIPAKYRDQSRSFQEAEETLSDQQKQDLKLQRSVESKRLKLKQELRKLEKKLASMETAVIIRGNQVIVPVRVIWRGRSADLRLLLDTGASITVLHRNAVAKLNPTARESSYAQVAGGGLIKTERVVFDRLDVGPYKIENKSTAVIENKRAAGFDGLLGMDILGGTQYEIDFANRKIVWSPDIYEQMQAALEKMKNPAPIDEELAPEAGSVTESQ